MKSVMILEGNDESIALSFALVHSLISANCSVSSQISPDKTSSMSAPLRRIQEMSQTLGFKRCMYLPCALLPTTTELFTFPFTLQITTRNPHQGIVLCCLATQGVELALPMPILALRALMIFYQLVPTKSDVVV